MKTYCLAGRYLVICAATAVPPSVSFGEIYKWVDANGRTHYSERKDEAGRARKVVTEAAPPSDNTAATVPSSEYWQDQERQFRQRQIQKGIDAKGADTTSTKKTKSLSGGREDGTDASKCNLARDIVSGAVKHWNGKPTDKYDIEIAENDIRMFCR